jgi:hypothetical protein
MRIACLPVSKIDKTIFLLFKIIRGRSHETANYFKDNITIHLMMRYVAASVREAV